MSNLTWTLAIVTYNRPDSLRRCIDFAMNQTRPPNEIAVVDASADWQSNRQIALDAAKMDIIFEPAKQAGITSQRNQLIKLATSEILFLIDDDSFMHANCAAEIMKVYEADTEKKIAGVGAFLSFSWPGAEESVQQPKAVPRSVSARINQLFERQLYVDKILLPYDDAYPDKPIPRELDHLNIGRSRYFDGFRMTFRRNIINQVGFDETLKKYAAAEDMDASYRASRHGALVTAYNARLYHDKDPSERLSRYARELLGYLNLAYLYRRNATDPKKVMRSYRRLLLRRMAINAMRDGSKRRMSLPCARAALKALRLSLKISRDADVSWYPDLQRAIIAQNAIDRLGADITFERHPKGESRTSAALSCDDPEAEEKGNSG